MLFTITVHINTTITAHTNATIPAHANAAITIFADTDTTDSPGLYIFSLYNGAKARFNKNHTSKFLLYFDVFPG